VWGCAAWTGGLSATNRFGARPPAASELLPRRRPPSPVEKSSPSALEEGSHERSPSQRSPARPKVSAAPGQSRSCRSGLTSSRASTSSRLHCSGGNAGPVAASSSGCLAGRDAAVVVRIFNRLDLDPVTGGGSHGLHAGGRGRRRIIAMIDFARAARCISSAIRTAGRGGIAGRARNAPGPGRQHDPLRGRPALHVLNARPGLRKKAAASRTSNGVSSATLDQAILAGDHRKGREAIRRILEHARACGPRWREGGAGPTSFHYIPKGLSRFPARLRAEPATPN